ncbi:MAG: sulfurtransferase [Deltaproteobacteria bacterium]|nr:sulfurtransferase [Deltaproteobacteria bacterium]NND29181.1 sulfurtransferase [Myxococcales bacterium]
MTLLGCGSSPASSACEGLPAEQCGEPDAGVPDGGAPVETELVVDTDWLEARLGDPDVQLIDTRSSGYDDSRIPGAIELRPQQLATTIDGVRAQLMPPMQGEPVLRAAGLRNEVTAVVYGEAPEYDPSRIVWALRYYGHQDVRYLDGGFAAWVAADGALDTDPPVTEPTEYTIVDVDEDLRVTGDWVLMQIGDDPYDMPAIQLVDARSEGEYDDGRIPSARSVNWTRNLDGGFLKSEAELETIYQGLDRTETTVSYCVTGWRGSFDWLTLTALGFEDVRLYDGSWTEWGSGEFPVERYQLQ